MLCTCILPPRTHQSLWGSMILFRRRTCALYGVGSSRALGSVLMVQAAANILYKAHSSGVLALPSPLSVTITSTQPENTICVNFRLIFTYDFKHLQRPRLSTIEVSASSWDIQVTISTFHDCVEGSAILLVIEKYVCWSVLACLVVCIHRTIHGAREIQ